MSINKIKVGIIGCGGIATGKHLPSLIKLQHVEVVGFYDHSPEKSGNAAKQFGTGDAKVFASYQELLADKTIDVVHVCTPNHTHAEISIAALEADKHVMCEKPMARTSAEARSMLETARRKGKKLTIGYQNRYRPDSQYLKQVCDRGDLGDIYFAKALAVRRRAVPTWGVFMNEEKQGGGPLLDIGTHALDLTLWMMNNYEPELVVGSTYKKMSSRPHSANVFGPWDPAKFTAEDSAFGFIKMKNGATIMLESSWALNSLQVGEAQTVLCGTEGGADMLDGLRIHGDDLNRLYIQQIDLSPGGVAFYKGQSETDADMEMRLWIESVAYDKELVVKPEEALVVTEILEAIYQSSETGQPVYL
ncbi:Gfo/Idh/MocA family protein [Paenibacillus eucommiae]|uniref:Dehydrogenase n=1 Tax=Paenibacillus eucommiae TaxID=1355755 RepID=A0ABS4J822_9BACL|nr:Gfo/Idh/MocA family oxidoreductase [Paenibacillus eucommiae]MBP1995990.1 putative dehydrogenase [Paenibacillus eucommiae]